MKKNTPLIVFLALLSVFIPTPAHTASELETWCLAQGQSWDSASATCTVKATLFPPGSLNILSSETLINNGSLLFAAPGQIINYGTIHNNIYFGTYYDAQLLNYGTINNNGRLEAVLYSVITNHGTINNSDILWNGAFFDNYGTINNIGEFVNYNKANNYGTINNPNTISNNDRLINNGTVRNICSGIYSGNPLEGNPVISFENCSHFPATLR